MATRRMFKTNLVKRSSVDARVDDEVDYLIKVIDSYSVGVPTEKTYSTTENVCRKEGFTIIGKGKDYENVNDAVAAGKWKLFLKRGYHNITEPIHKASLAKRVVFHVRGEGDGTETTLDFYEKGYSGCYISEGSFEEGNLQISSGTLGSIRPGDTVITGGGFLSDPAIAVGNFIRETYKRSGLPTEKAYIYSAKIKSVTDTGIEIEKPWEGEEMISGSLYIMPGYRIDDNGVIFENFILENSNENILVPQTTPRNREVFFTDGEIKAWSILNYKFSDLTFARTYREPFFDDDGGFVTFERCTFNWLPTDTYLPGASTFLDCQFNEAPSYQSYDNCGHAFYRCIFEKAVESQRDTWLGGLYVGCTFKGASFFKNYGKVIDCIIEAPERYIEEWHYSSAVVVGAAADVELSVSGYNNTTDIIISVIQFVSGVPTSISNSLTTTGLTSTNKIKWTTLDTTGSHFIIHYRSPAGRY